MPGTFGARMQALREEVGDGLLEGTVEVNQVYAWNQEHGYWLNYMGRYGFKTLHPRHGGETHFLHNSLENGRGEYLQRLADRAFEPLGLVNAMVENMEWLSAAVAVNAPVETGALRGSGHPSVVDNGAVVYDRAPSVERKMPKPDADTDTDK